MALVAYYRPNGWWFLNDMSTLEISILRTSFALIRNRLETVATAAYERLFDEHPESFKVFVRKNVMPISREEIAYSWETREHGLRVLSILERCLHRLDRRDEFANLISGLAARHLGYGASPLFIISLTGCFLTAVVKEFELANVAAANADLSNLLAQSPELNLSMIWNKFFKAFGLALVAEMLALDKFITPQPRCPKITEKSLEKPKKRFWNLFLKTI